MKLTVMQNTMPSLSEVAKTTLDKKNAMSKFLKVAPGQTVHIDRVRSFQSVDKSAPDGSTKPVVKFTVDVDTEFGLVSKVFEVGSAKLINELVDAGVTVGSSFDISRQGEMLETVYTISNVVNPPVNPLA